MEAQVGGRKRGARILFGVTLMAVGILLTLESLHAIDGGPIHRYWPLLVIAMGATKLYETWGTGDAGSGLTLLLAGFWMLGVTLKVWGLTWKNSWALMLVAVGIGMVVRSLVGCRDIAGGAEEARRG